MGQYCSTGAVYTYNSKFKYPHSPEFNAEGGNPTQGGYSQYIVVQEDYVMKIPTNLDLAAATPLLCAGITVYSPMKHYGLKRGQKLAVVGLGGLGHMAVKFGKAFGAHVTVISRSESKRDTALAMGADDFVSSADEKNLAAVSCAFDMIINTISAAHNMMAIIGTLGFEGTMVMVGAGPDPMPISFGALIGKRRKVNIYLYLVQNPAVLVVLHY